MGIHKYRELITFVTDRMGHDARYAVDSRKIMKELNWIPMENFESGIKNTIQWYLDNQRWCKHIQNGSYRD